MNFTKSGNCSKCGAPIWTPASWGGAITPPPNHFSCNCNGGQVIVTATPADMPSSHSTANHNSVRETSELSLKLSEVMKMMTDVCKRLDDLEKQITKTNVQKSKPFLND